MKSDVLYYAQSDESYGRQHLGNKVQSTF